MLKAILFDLDGTLIDSEHFYFDCWNEILAEAGVKLTYDDWLDNYSGTTVYTNAGKLSAKYGITTPIGKLVARREKLTIERFKTTDVNLMPFVPEVLNFLYGKGVTMAIATSSMRNDVDAIFERNGLSRFFKLMVTRNDVVNGKPHPETYELCCKQLGLAKDECIVFEDTVTGLTAAKAAGLVCYAIQSNINEHPKLQAADKIFPDLNEAKEYLISSGLIRD